MPNVIIQRTEKPARKPVTLHDVPPGHYFESSEGHFVGRKSLDGKTIHWLHQLGDHAVDTMGRIVPVRQIIHPNDIEITVRIPQN